MHKEEKKECKRFTQKKIWESPISSFESYERVIKIAKNSKC